MDQAYRERIATLKRAIIAYLAGNGRHYGDLSRIEQKVEDLAQALNAGLDQLDGHLRDDGRNPIEPQTPRDRLSSRLMETAIELVTTGRVDSEMADDFEQALDAFDSAANLRRKADDATDAAESAAIRHKRSR